MIPPDTEPTLRGPAVGRRVFGRYALEKILGRGGMGVVWAARDETLGENVALKFLPDAVRWDPAAFDDLKAETRRARQLTHPNIVRIHDFVEEASAAAISMELVDGKTLTELRLEKENKIFEPADIAPWLPQLCAALDYAHTQARVVHRDLKPSNVMLTSDGALKVADFGVARSLADSITRVSMMSAGTLVYMSPQQAMGEEPSPADDIYALGATLYELLTGKPPFHTGDVRMQLFQRKPAGIAARRRALGVTGTTEVPPAWEKTIADCLAKDAEKRPRSVSEIAARLGAPTPMETVSGVGGHVPVPAWVGRAPRARPRVRRSFLIAALAAALAFAAWNFWPRSGPVATLRAAAAFPSDATRARAAWNFDGDARDGSGRALDGAADRTVPTTDRFGRIDRALHFNGNAEVVVADAPLLRWDGARPFTAALWVRNDESGPVSGAVWSSAGDTVGAPDWSLGFSNGRPSAYVARRQDGEYGEAIQLTADRALPAGEWHHLALVSDGAALALFVDGAKGVAQPLGPNRAAPAPRHVELRFGRPERLSTWAFAGDLDDARLWRRALAPEEIAALASRERPPHFSISKGTGVETGDFAAALRTEFGAAAKLADWDDLKRLHGDDARAWGDEMGFRVGDTIGWLQRGGRRMFDAKRHYFLTRLDGVKPGYFLAHDEFGGATFALGSWYGNQSHLLVARPAAPPHEIVLTAGADGAIRHEGALGGDAVAFALVWRLALAPGPEHGVMATLRLRDGRELRAACQSTAGDAVAVALGDATAGGRAWQAAATYGECEFTLVARDGLLRFRAVSVVGGNPIFQQDVAVPGLRLAEVAAVEISGAAQSRLASARLIIE